jgi:hypothetical protein
LYNIFIFNKTKQCVLEQGKKEKGDYTGWQKNKPIYIKKNVMKKQDF